MAEYDRSWQKSLDTFELSEWSVTLHSGAKLTSNSQDLWIKIFLSCFGRGFLGRSFDKLAVDEGRSGADQGDEVRRVDGAPAVLS